MRVFRFALLISITIMLVACSSGSSEEDPKQATANAIATSLASAATSDAQNIPPEGSNSGTASSQATEQALSFASTQTAHIMQEEEARSATATVYAPVIERLPNFGIDPSSGKPGWIHPPVSIEVNGYRQFGYANDYLNKVVVDFVISSDITWNSQYGGSGCGFMVRSDGNEEAYNQYVIIISRGNSGHVYMGVMANGEVVNWRDIYAYGIDPEFDWQNDATNNLTVVGRGQLFTVYTNGTLVGELDPSQPAPPPVFPPPPQPPASNDPVSQAQFRAEKAAYDAVVNEIKQDYAERQRLFKESNVIYERGFVAMVAVSESGYTFCQFNNTWLWLLDGES